MRFKYRGQHFALTRRVEGPHPHYARAAFERLLSEVTCKMVQKDLDMAEAYRVAGERHVDDSKASNPKDSAATTRLDLSLFPDTARAYGALAFTEGDLKYGGYNFREAGAKASVYVAALGRHMAKWYDGEETDPTTKVPHLANALACIAVLIDGTVQGNLNDDRPPSAGVAKVLDDAQAIVAHLQQTFPRKAARVTRAKA